MIVSNAGPLISFVRVNKLALLHKIFQKIAIPPAVHAELIQGFRKPGMSETGKLPWIEILSLESPEDINKLPHTLGDGEKEAILLARERRLPLLIDDLAARKAAIKEGVRIIGTLGVLIHDKEIGEIENLKEVLDEFLRHDFRLRRELYQKALQKVGEI
ncbi:MAG TPA: DUF3368 domain-containing protein [Candidatus Tripitaka californicus]|uniref:DUF3368 domain-containing protein n=1 Tax=Candidatus Tripitaka californicus TaxID=3367616 RepID=UPI00402A152D